MTMGRFGTHFDRTTTWWEPGRAWLLYIRRSQFLLQQGTHVAEALCFVGEASPNTGIDYKALKEAGIPENAFIVMKVGETRVFE